VILEKRLSIAVVAACVATTTAARWMMIALLSLIKVMALVRLAEALPVRA
jgi:hypothetical protein